jgi:hypothetical protein
MIDAEYGTEKWALPVGHQSWQVLSSLFYLALFFLF